MRRWLVPVLLAFTACSDNLTPPPDHEPYGDGGLMPPLGCVPNLDGRIEAGELVAALGVPVTYLASPAGEARPVDLVGAVDAAGRRVWDWSAPADSDRALVITAAPLTGKWYAASFPPGQFVTPLDAGGSVEAVYRQEESAILLCGMASALPDPPEGQTLLVYDTPVTLYQFPLAPGSQWVSVGTVQNGVIRELPYAGRDTYEVTVDAAGQLKLPDLTFSQALRVRTTVNTEPAVGMSFSQRQVSFLFECFGEVARAKSALNEPNVDFTTATEIRRLGLE
jgi:hypothetical protein